MYNNKRKVWLSSKSPNILVWKISVSSSQLRRSLLVHSMRQLVSFLRISWEGSQPSQVTRERVAFCFKGYLLPFSDSTLSCSTTVLRRQTTWANGHCRLQRFHFLNYFFVSSPSPLGIGDALEFCIPTNILVGGDINGNVHQYSIIVNIVFTM